MTIGTSLFAGALLVAVALSLGSYVGLLIRELFADKQSGGRWEDADE